MADLKLRIMGLDPGTGITGFGIIDVIKNKPIHVAHGVITTSPDIEMPKRLLIIADDLRQLIEKYRPDEVAIEQLYFARNTTTAISVAQSRGVLLVTLAAANKAIYEYTPLQIKQSVGGSGAAKKIEIQRMVCRLLNLNDIPKPDDAADGLAVALTHNSHRKLHQR